MLDYAYFHQGELYDCYRKVYTRKELYFYLSYPQKDFIPNIYCNDSDYLQFVSLNSDKEIIGFFNGYKTKIIKVYKTWRRRCGQIHHL